MLRFFANTFPERKSFGQELLGRIVQCLLSSMAPLHFEGRLLCSVAKSAFTAVRLYVCWKSRHVLFALCTYLYIRE